MSIAAMSGRWLRRKLRQVGEGTLGRHGIQRPTVAWLISMPSLSSSPWMRGAPHNGLALLVRLARLAQIEKSGGTGGEARSGRKLGQKETSMNGLVRGVRSKQSR